MQRDEWDEQSELRELNARLELYVRRVRDLEQENRLLAQELVALRGREGRACRWQETEQEVAELRRVVAELSRAKGEAELEREALRQERERLERLSAQAGELRRRRRLEPELAQQQQRLAGLRADCAALEALLEQLLGERERLREARKQRPAALLPGPRVLRAGRVDGRRLEADYALELRWSCAQSLERYEAELRALQELEGRLGHQELRKLRAQSQESHRRLQELWRRCRELCALGQRLEEERLAQQERHGAELAEYQMIIEALEDEKNYLTLSIAEFLKDYHELLQVKAALSLEIATYRALLEGESSQWILMWNEEHGRKLPQDDRKLRYEYSNRYSSYQQDKGKRALPAIANVDLRYKFPQTNISRSVVSSSKTGSAAKQTVFPEKKGLPKELFGLGQHPSTAAKRYVTHERSLIGQRERQSFMSPYRMSREGDGQPRPPAPERKTPEMGSMASALKESTILQKQMKRPMSSEGIRATVIVSSPLSPSSTSSSKGSQYETREGILGQINKLIQEGKPGKEEKDLLVEGVEQKEKVTQEATGSAAKNGEKLNGLEKKVQKKVEIEESLANKEDTVEHSIFKDKTTEEKLMKDKRPSRRWEEQVEAVEAEERKNPEITATFGREKIVSISSRSQEPLEIPVHSGHTDGKILKKNHNTLQDLKTSPEKSKSGTEFKLSNEMIQDNVSKEENSKIDTSLTESMAENIVSDILKGFVQKSSEEGLPPEAKITSFEKKNISEDGKVKTKISIESTVQRDGLDMSKSELGSFLEKDIKKVLDDTKGSLDENVIEGIINAGMKGMEDKAKRTIKVKIIEEPATIVDEKVEFSTPFEVEEAEDASLNLREHPYYSDKEKATTSVAGDLKEKPTDEIVPHVEEVSEGDEVVDEEKYFVSTPDEYPFGYVEGESSTYGQIHFEEESIVKYAWQDEFLEGSQTNIKESMASPELIYQVIGADVGPFISKAESPKEEVAHTESVVIKKEIKIPHEFQESIKEVFSQQAKDPKHQLKEALGKLEATLPELVKQELGELTKEDKADSSTLEVDIKKVEHPEKEGLFTIVAEVNLSQTIDSDQLSTELLDEAVTKQIKFPKQSPKEGGFDRYIQEPETWQDEKHQADVSSTLWTTEETSKREDAYPSKESFDINRRIRHVVIGPTEIRKTEHVFYEGPISETLEFGTTDFTTGVSADAGQFMKSVKLSPETMETRETIIYRSPIYTSEEVSYPENSTQTQVSSDISSSKHITLDSKQIVEEVTFEGSASDLTSDNSRDIFSKMEDPTAISTSIRHIQIDPKEIHIERKIYGVPFPTGDYDLSEETVKKITLGQKDTPTSDQNIYQGSFTKTSDDASVKLGEEKVLDVNTTIRHIKLSPKEFVSEQVVFTEPISEQHQKVSELGQMFSSEGSVHHVKLGQKEVQSHDIMSQDFVLQSPGALSSKEDTWGKISPAETNRSTHHIQIGQGLHGLDAQPFSGMEFPPTDGPSENSRSVGQVKLGQKEASFTFHMDISKMAGREPQATIVASSRKEAGNGQLEGSMEEAWKDPEGEQKLEESMFDQTVQLQRIVDQRSVVSDEKKIALLYLNENEGGEEEEEEGPWF